MNNIKLGPDSIRGVDDIPPSTFIVEQSIMLSNMVMELP